MSLVPGSRLGPYEIVSTLGAGGMGEVYRARDTRLKRDVAVKVLPANVADNPERLGPVDISDDGKVVIFTESGGEAGANYAVCMRRTDGSPVVVLGEGAALDLSDDGRWVLAGIFPNRLVAYPAGAGQAVELKTTSLGLVGDARWLPGQKQVLLLGGSEKEANRCFLVDFPGGSPRAVSESGIVSAIPMPDGKRMILLDADLNWWIAGFDSSSSRTRISELQAGDGFAGWQRDGRGLFVFDTNRVPSPVAAIDLTTGRRREVITLDPKSPGVLYIRPAILTPDASAYTYGSMTYISRLYTMEGAH